MDHQHGVVSHVHLVSTHRDQAGDREGHAIHFGGDVSFVAAHRVKDGQAIRHGTSHGINAHRDGINIQRIEFSDEVAGRNSLVPPAFTDVAVDENFSRSQNTGRRRCHGGLAANCVPFLRCAHVKLPAFVGPQIATECRQSLGFSVQFLGKKLDYLQRQPSLLRRLAAPPSSWSGSCEPLSSRPARTK